MQPEKTKIKEGLGKKARRADRPPDLQYPEGSNYHNNEFCPLGVPTVSSCRCRQLSMPSQCIVSVIKLDHPLLIEPITRL